MDQPHHRRAEVPEWIGTYGSLENVIIQLAEEHEDGPETVVRAWPEEHV
ncbi:hypothetical protein [Streptomyces sp. NPDC059003]